MRQLLLSTLLLSSMALAQQETTGADKATSGSDETGNPIILTTKKRAEPTAGTTQHRQTDLNFLKRSASTSTTRAVGSGKRGEFSCPDGTELSCLDPGDKVCPPLTKCVADGATCFDAYPCDVNGSFVCESEYDDVLKTLRETVRQHDELASENVALRERRLEQKNCVLNASSLKAARYCVRSP